MNMNSEESDSTNNSNLNSNNNSNLESETKNQELQNISPEKDQSVNKDHVDTKANQALESEETGSDDERELEDLKETSSINAPQTDNEDRTDDISNDGDDDTRSYTTSTDAEDSSDALEDPNNLEKMILSTGIRVGTPIKTKYMSSFITRANPEGLYILDISKTLARIDVAAKFIGRTNIANVAVTSAREYGKTPIEKFCELTGARGIFGRFMPGTFTNPSLPKYLEPEIVIVTDPQADEQAVLEATRAGVPVIALSNSDNITSKVDLVIPSNNRGRKALATVYWLLTKEVLKKQGRIKSDSEMPMTIDDFEAKLVEELI
ncbi:30S ribosomal protein S2 [Candidatus Nitrosocosmicus franklandus]|uniref:Small ribosomal subunit protein uS2 n=2 Tax=Candidatus Nitrosocosmicus franklandianus TaxID=1798806 RepID=A0A484IDN9_9ARCH|nr:30S ribosomal protein S2 [Candidatus Nitrosocosmicus franklandus]